MSLPWAHLKMFSPLSREATASQQLSPCQGERGSDPGRGRLGRTCDRSNPHELVLMTEMVERKATSYIPDTVLLARHTAFPTLTTVQHKIFVSHFIDEKTNGSKAWDRPKVTK